MVRNMERLGCERHPHSRMLHVWGTFITVPGTTEILEYCHQTAADLTAGACPSFRGPNRRSPLAQGSMNGIKVSPTRSWCATAVGALTLCHPAAAQTDAQIQTIQQQIKQLQNQLNQMKADLAARDRAVKAAQQQAKEAQDQAAAAQGQAAAASSQAAQVANRAASLTADAPRAVPCRPLDSHAGRVRGGRRYLQIAQPRLQHRHQF